MQTKICSILLFTTWHLFLSTTESVFTLKGVSLSDAAPNNWDCTLPTSFTTIDASTTGRAYVLIAWTGYTSGTLQIRTSSMNSSQLLNPTTVTNMASSGCFRVFYSATTIWNMLQSDQDQLIVNLYLDSTLVGSASAYVIYPFSVKTILVYGSSQTCDPSVSNGLTAGSPPITINEISDQMVTVCCIMKGYQPGSSVVVEIENGASGYSSVITTLSPLKMRFSGWFSAYREAGYLLGLAGIGSSRLKARYQDTDYLGQEIVFDTSCQTDCLRPPADVFSLPFPEGERWVLGGSPHGRGDMFAASNETLALLPSTQQIVQATPANLHYTSLDFNNPDKTVSPLNWSITASASGQVITVSRCKVEIDHGHGWKTLYYHLINPIVKVGEYVDKGHKLAGAALLKSDALCEGGAWNGPHVHFQLTWFGIGAVDGTTFSDYIIHAGRYSYDDDCSYAFVTNYTETCIRHQLSLPKTCIGHQLTHNRGLHHDVNTTRQALSKNGGLMLYVVSDTDSNAVSRPQRYLNISSDVCFGNSSILPSFDAFPGSSLSSSAAPTVRSSPVGGGAGAGGGGAILLRSPSTSPTTTRNGAVNSQANSVVLSQALTSASMPLPSSIKSSNQIISNSLSISNALTSTSGARWISSARSSVQGLGGDVSSSTASGVLRSSTGAGAAGLRTSNIGANSTDDSLSTKSSALKSSDLAVIYFCILLSLCIFEF